MTKDEILSALQFATMQLDSLRGMEKVRWPVMRANSAINEVIYELGNADISSDGPKTNFEKWKGSLSAIEAIDMMGKCHRCPARENCGHKASDCVMSFIKWAKETTK